MRSLAVSVAALACAALVVGAASSTSAEFFAAPGGRPDGNGSLERPWDLQTALNQPPAVAPGATIWLRGGSDTGSFVYFTDVMTRTYEGGALAVPMKGHPVAAPVGWPAPPTTVPAFGVFILTKQPAAARRQAR